MLRTLAQRRALLPLALVGALTATGLAACSSDGSVDAKVVRVVDGDTFEAEYGGQTKTVRLLNVDTPETKHPNKIVECQGPEATRFLQEKLPAGKTVKLRFDQEGTDKYNRVLAATFLGDELVNASIARAGLGVAISIAPNTKYYEPVKAAQDEAKAKKAGLFQDNLACSPEVVAQQLAASAATADPAADASSTAIAASAASLLTAISSARAGSDLIKDAKDAVIVSALGLSGLTKAEGKVTDALTKATARHKTLTDRAATVKAEEEQKAAEAAAEEKRRADEAAAAAAEAAQTKAAAEAEAKAAAEAEAARQAAAQAPAAPSNGSSSAQNPYPGYYGPRCYAPGGQTWTPCPEKAPGYGQAPTATNPYPGYVGPRCYAPGGKSWTPCPKK